MPLIWFATGLKGSRTKIGGFRCNLHCPYQMMSAINEVIVFYKSRTPSSFFGHYAPQTELSGYTTELRHPYSGAVVSVYKASNHVFPYPFQCNSHSCTLSHCLSPLSPRSLHSRFTLGPVRRITVPPLTNSTSHQLSTLR
jgi:hypothetical protein